MESKGNQTPNLVAKYVKDLETVRRFFEKYFDDQANELYHNRKKRFKSYFLSSDDSVRLEIISKENISHDKLTQEHLGFIHLAFSVGSKKG
ncbi:VOC family protein [Streptococcus mutans]|uniref:VOC family protein n=1 Tax=Streptococcus mutans TaxID=1309 RepID=UPI003082951E